ncbi:MAG: hypothetical protein ACTHK1_08685 [Actinomycetales bacterium]
MTEAAAASAPGLLPSIDALTAQVREARTLPMSASVVLHREELLTALAALREAATAEAEELARLRADQEGVLAAARAEAARIVTLAAAERQQLLATDGLVRGAQSEADRILRDAREQALGMRREVDDYVDGKLAHFEVALTRVLAAVHRGRGLLAERLDVGPIDGLLESPLDAPVEGPVERSVEGRVEGRVEGSAEGSAEGSVEGAADARGSEDATAAQASSFTTLSEASPLR